MASTFPRREAEKPLPGRRPIAAAVAAAAAAVVEPLEGRRLLAVTVELEQSITNPSPAVGGEFGASVATRGNWVLVGQPSYDTNTHQNVGRALLYNTVTGDSVTVENPNFSDGDTSGEFDNDQFGLAVAILGNNKIAVSASEADRNVGTGAVFIIDAPFLATNSGSGTINTASQTWHGADDIAAFGTTLVAYGTDQVLVYTDDLIADPETSLSGVGLYNSNFGESSGTAFFSRPGGFFNGTTMAVDGSNVLVSYSPDGSEFAVDLIGPGGSLDYGLDAYLGTYSVPGGFGGRPGLAAGNGFVLIGSQAAGKVYRYASGDVESAPIEYAAPIAGPGTFGAQVAIVGDDHFVVTDSIHSRVYVYELDGATTAVATLGAGLADSPASGLPNQLGVALAALPGDRFVVTDPFKDDGATSDVGIARVFELTDAPAGPTAPIELFEGILYVSPAAAASINITGNGDTVTVTMGANKLTVLLSAITGGRIEVRGSSGNDVVSVSSSVKTNIWAFGNGGNDSIRSGGGDDVIVGGDGADLLVGGNGRDLIVGSDGADRIVGEQEDDILIAGTTDYDADLVGLGEIMDAWTGDPPFTDRVNELRGGILDPNANVTDDGDVDVLTGNSGSDWFIYTESMDVITDLKSKDFVNDLPWITAL